MLRSTSRQTEQSRARNHPGSDGRLCLLVILKPYLTLAKSPGWPLRGFALDGKEYRDAALGEWTGFYDWLRAADGTLLGVRYRLNEETEFLAPKADGLAYVGMDSSLFLEIYFSNRRDVEPQRSADQDFLYDPVFRSDEGEYALGFAIEDLSESELSSIDNAQAHWGVLGTLE